MEIWKDIPGYEGLYRVSNMGQVLGLRRNRVLKPQVRQHGYLSVWLYKDGFKPKQVSVHRLVASAFCPKPYGYDEVNHINEDKTDNRAANLEWCDHKMNAHYGTAIERRVEKQVNGKCSKQVRQLTLTGDFVAEFPSLAEAQRQLGFAAGNILRCIQGKYSHAYGYLWQYAT